MPRRGCATRPSAPDTPPPAGTAARTCASDRLFRHVVTSCNHADQNYSCSVCEMLRGLKSVRPESSKQLSSTRPTAISRLQHRRDDRQVMSQIGEWEAARFGQQHEALVARLTQRRQQQALERNHQSHRKTLHLQWHCDAVISCSDSHVLHHGSAHAHSDADETL